MQNKTMRLIDSLKFDPANSRKHDERNIKSIMDSLKMHGQRKPIVLYSDMIVAGNGTVEAAKRLGWSEVWVNNDSFDSIEHAKAYALQDNRSAELAAWDDMQLGDTLTELKEAGYDLEGLGWNDGDLKEIMSDKSVTEGLTDPDEVPEVAQNEFGVKRGDIWKLGNHRLMCGDSTIKENVEKLMNGEKADMVFTDPPYGMNLDTDFSSMESYTKNHQGKTATGTKKIERNKNTYKAVLNDDKPFNASFIIEMAKEVFLWGADYYKDTIPCGGSWMVWDKKTTEGLQKMFGADFELLWSKVPHERKIIRHTWSSCFGFDKKNDGNKRVHPTQKPAVMCANIIKEHSEDANLVSDLFLGSGSTLIACEKTGRKCYGMELDEHYCSVIIKRWQDFTGKKAEKISEAV